MRIGILLTGTLFSGGLLRLDDFETKSSWGLLTQGSANHAKTLRSINVDFQDEKVDKLLEEHQSLCARVAAILQDESSWKEAYYAKDEAKAKKLLSALNLVPSLSASGIDKVLVQHITYSPFEGQHPDNVTLEMKFPAYSALVSSGTSAIHELVTILKKVDPNVGEYKDAAKSARHLAVWGLIKIYERGGFGKALARQRLTLEMEKASDEDRKRLDTALRYYAFGNDK